MDEKFLIETKRWYIMCPERNAKEYAFFGRLLVKWVSEQQSIIGFQNEKREKENVCANIVDSRNFPEILSAYLLHLGLSVVCQLTPLLRDRKENGGWHGTHVNLTALAKAESKSGRA